MAEVRLHAGQTRGEAPTQGSDITRAAGRRGFGHHMRKLTLAAGLIVAVVLAVVWLQGWFDWLVYQSFDVQRSLQNALAGAIRQIKSGQPGAVLGLVALCFGYGVVHAIGPGHGKMLLGSYALSNRVSPARLVGFSVAASLAQAGFAVVLVYAGVLLFSWTREQMVGMAEQSLTAASYLMIGAIGVYLAWRGARMIARTWGEGGQGGAAHAADGQSGHDPAGDHAGHDDPGRDHPDNDHATVDHATYDHAGHDHATYDHAGHDHAGHDHTGHEHTGHDHAGHNHTVHDHATHHHATHTRASHVHSGHAHPHTCHSAPHDHDDHSGHSHGPSLSEIGQVRGWRDGLMLVAGVAVRPCSGALLVLLLCWRIGNDAAGIAGTLAMGLGTAVITIIAALLAMTMREATWAAGLDSVTMRRVSGVLGVVAGAVLVLTSAVLVRPYL